MELIATKWGKRTMPLCLIKTLCCFLTFICCLLCAIPGQSQDAGGAKISLQVRQQPLHEVFKEIELKTGFVIEYRLGVVNKDKLVSIQAKDESVQEILKKLLRGSGIRLVQQGKSILIVKETKPLSPPNENPALKKDSGRITGKILDEENGQPVAGATVLIGNKGIITDENGMFSFSLPGAKYEAEISFIGYGIKKVTNIEIKNGETFTLDIPLKREKGQLGAVTVSARRIKESGTNIAIVKEIRESKAIVSGISREQIQRSQDRDASEILKRVAGVSIIQNRFAIVRGMPQRYNVVMLNNVTAPSFEADSRAFSFETVPSGLVDRIMIYKTALPELPGDFAGGVIKIYTPTVPANNGFTISYAASVRPNTTFREFYEQKQGKYAWLGYDDGTYASPIKNILAHGELLFRTDYSKYLNDNWDADSKKAGPDHRFSLGFNRLIRFSEKVKLGIVSNLSYTNTYQQTTVSRNIGQSSQTRKMFVVFYNLVDKLYEHNVRLNGLANISLDIDKGRHVISFRNLYTHLGSFEYLSRKGEVRSDGNDGLGLTEGMLMQNQLQGNTYKSIYNAQLGGDHILFKNTRADWLLGYTTSLFNDPDQRVRLQTTPREGNVVDSTGNFIWEEKMLYDAVGNSPSAWRRNFFRLPETTKSFALNLTQAFSFGRFTPTIKAGIYLEEKSRSFSYEAFNKNLRIGGSQPELWYNGANPNGQYLASYRLNAGYLSLQLPFTKKVSLYGGIRLEEYRFQLSGFHWVTAGELAGPVEINKQVTTPLPSVNLVFNITEKNQLRAGYAKTLNRAEFRELSPFQFYDMNLFQYTYGNPDMAPQTNIHNIDLRWELYPLAGEMLSLGVFYKHIKKPYEQYAFDYGGSGNSYFWGYADYAKIYGAELEAMIGMGRFFSGNSWTSKQLQKVSILANITYSYSRLRMQDSINSFGQTIKFGEHVIKDRQLYGQSPYLINIGLNFTDPEAGLKTNLSYNIIGKRIVAVGSLNNPSTVEMPRHALDLTFSKRLLKNLELMGGIQNILDSRFKMMQDANHDGKFEKNPDVFKNLVSRDNLARSWYSGAYYTLGFSWTM